MTLHATRAQNFKDVLVGALLGAAAIAGSGCGAESSGADTALWEQYIRVMDDARGRGDFYAADMARQAAYRSALGSRRWDAIAAAGDASARFAEGFPTVRPSMRPELRRIYRAALLCARQQDSLEGVLRVTETFAELGDREQAREGLTLATAMLVTNRGLHGAERLQALADRLDYVASAPGESPETVRAPVAPAAWSR